MGLFDEGLTDDRTVLEHVLQVDQVAVVFFLCEIVGVVEVDDSLLVGSDDLLRQQDTHGQILADLPRHIVALGGVDDRVLVGIFLIDLFVEVLDEGQDPVVRGVGFSGKFPLVTVSYIFLSDFVAAHFHDGCFHQVLNVLHVDCMGHLRDLSRHVVCDRLDLVFVHLIDRLDLLIGTLDGVDDLQQIKRDLLTVPFDYIYSYIIVHKVSFLLLLWILCRRLRAFPAHASSDFPLHFITTTCCVSMHRFSLSVSRFEANKKGPETRKVPEIPVLSCILLPLHLLPIY